MRGRGVKTAGRDKDKEARTLLCCTISHRELDFLVSLGLGLCGDSMLMSGTTTQLNNLFLLVFIILNGRLLGTSEQICVKNP